MPPMDSSPDSKNQQAFKEWAVVVDALGRGEQTLLLRKGGIHEDAGTFRASYGEFFLYPTFEHQKSEDIIPEVWQRFEAREHPESQSDPFVQYYATLEETIKVQDLNQAKALIPFTVYAPQVVDKRFHWGEEKALYVLITRIHRLPAAIALEAKESYAGCKSWVALEQTLSLEGIQPVLDEKTFEQKAAQVRGILDV